jgi:retron-type reverse transcriptase
MKTLVSITDKKVLRLIGAFLQVGVLENGLVSPAEEGAPQGGPSSPLLSTIVLDELDRQLERCKHRSCGVSVPNLCIYGIEIMSCYDTGAQRTLFAMISRFQKTAPNCCCCTCGGRVSFGEGRPGM